MRAGVITEVAPALNYASLAEFAKHVALGRVKQQATAGKEKLVEKEAPRDPNVLVPEPHSHGPRAFRVIVEQTIEYALEGRTLKLTEDLLKNEALERQIDGVTLDPKLLWESDFFKWDPSMDLNKVLAPFMK